LRQLCGGPVEIIDRRANLAIVFAGFGAFQFAFELRDLLLLCATESAPGSVLARFFQRQEDIVRLHASFDDLTLVEILLREIEGIENHLLDLLVSESISRL